MVRKKVSEYDSMTVSQLIEARKVLQAKIDQIDDVLSQAAAALGVTKRVASSGGSPIRRETDLSSDPTLITSSAPPPPQVDGLAPMGVSMGGPPVPPMGGDFNSFTSGDVSPAVRMIEAPLTSADEVSNIYDEITSKLRSIDPT